MWNRIFHPVHAKRPPTRRTSSKRNLRLPEIGDVFSRVHKFDACFRRGREGGRGGEEFEKRLERMEIKRKSILGSDFRVR